MNAFKNSIKELNHCNKNISCTLGDIGLKYSKILLPYFFDKTELFSLQNNPKNQDPSCKTDIQFGIVWEGYNSYYRYFMGLI